MQIIKVGLCAFGMSGKVFHAPFIKEHPGFLLAAIVERNREESKEKYPEATIYRSVSDMLENADIDLVVVNSPIQTHFEYVKMALEAGKNVIVEKPFTVNVRESEMLVNLAKEKNLFLSVYQNRRFDRDYLQFKKILDGGKLGNIKEAEISYDRFRIEASEKAHKENPDLPGSGALHDLGSHLIDQAVHLFGFPEKLFADVFAMKGSAFANDYFEIILYYENDLRVRLKASVFAKETHNEFILQGEKGSFLQERTDTQESEVVSGIIPKLNENWTKNLEKPDGILNYQKENSEWERQLTSSEAGNYMDYYQEIYDHFVSNLKLPSPGTEVIQNMKIIDAVLESATEEKVVYLN
ncbi:Gfo/Idh/MocA family oxidoreductase [Halpernia frigidisoli]|uniref:Predicted dehydrogenase n=1 Tax=Halpernia frigidisoli TaxID=1125876 RepID=A0A1I3F3A6_9FLAO|nr:Gfo/Idh/MocA family oxidoreductase [Halpernia frigidisoli]SFI05668.1 Predicted dehydrogenase [Halpernia frigidisoli]